MFVNWYPAKIWEDMFNLMGTKILAATSLTPHTRTHWQPGEIKCSPCISSFFSRNALRKHRERVHERKRYECPYCQNSYTDINQFLTNHIGIGSCLRVMRTNIIALNNDLCNTKFLCDILRA